MFLAHGSTAQLDAPSPFAYEPWNAGLITCYQYRAYLQHPAEPIAYATLEMHYYVSARSGRNAIAWMFPKRDHLSIGLGIMGKVGGKALRAELDDFLPTVERRLFPGISYTVREEGNLLYGGKPRPRIADGGVMLGGTAAGLVDATTGEGIHEAATTGRFAAAAVVAQHRGRTASASRHFERRTRRAMYGRLRHRHGLMTFLERKPARFDVLFEQLERTPKFAQLLQRDQNGFSAAEWAYLYAQAATFALRALRVT